MSLLSDQELVDLKTGDEVFLLLVHVGHDGIRRVLHAGRTTMYVGGKPGQRWYHSPECDKYGGTWSEDQMNTESLTCSSLKAHFFSAAEGCGEALKAEKFLCRKPVPARSPLAFEQDSTCLFRLLAS